MSESSLIEAREDSVTAMATDHTGIAGAVIAAAPCTSDTAANNQAVAYTPAEQFMRRLLVIRDPDPTVTDEKVNRLFETSILISAIRCILAYVVFPIFAPALYAASDWGPALGLTVGAVALVFDVAGIRRFWKANHRWRWPMTGIYACVMVLVVILVIHDISYLLN